MIKYHMSITVVIYSFDEEKNIADCINSAKLLTDKIILIDMESKDRTIEVAKSLQVAVYNFPRSNYVEPAREFGIKKAESDWVFILDADERITEELAKEIKQLLINNSSLLTYFKIPRKNIFAGKRWLKHGGWWPDYVKRLFLKDKLLGWIGDLHEEPKFVGEMGFLTEPMIHLKHDNLHDMAVKTNKWSNTEAKLLIGAKHPPMVAWRFFRVMFTELSTRLFIKKGVFDGQDGVVYAIYQSFSKFVTYAKLWEKQILKKH